ncbi:MAG: hypothetical protein WBC97_11465 [Gemmatimonadales bacterium]
MRKILVLALGLAGVSAPLAAQKRAAAPAAYWQTSVGFSAGFQNTYVPSGGLSVTSFAGPGIGSDPALGVGGIANPPVLFAIFPLHGRFAIEPGLDVHNYSSGSSGVTTAAVSARVDYSLNRTWYAAAGGAFYYANGGTVSGESVAGANLAVGARFHLTGPVAGRFELGYGFRGASADMFGAQTLSYLFGLTVPIH